MNSFVLICLFLFTVTVHAQTLPTPTLNITFTGGVITDTSPSVRSQSLFPPSHPSLTIINNDTSIASLGYVYHQQPELNYNDTTVGLYSDSQLTNANFSICLWFNIYSIDSNQINSILFGTTSSSGARLNVQIDDLIPNPQISATFFYNINSAQTTLTLSSAAIVYGKWNSLCITYNDATKTAKGYINATLTDTQAIANNFLPFFNAGLAFGTTTSSSSNQVAPLFGQYRGEMDNILVFQSELSLAQIALLPQPFTVPTTTAPPTTSAPTNATSAPTNATSAPTNATTTQPPTTIPPTTSPPTNATQAPTNASTTQPPTTQPPTTLPPTTSAPTVAPIPLPYWYVPLQYDVKDYSVNHFTNQYISNPTAILTSPLFVFDNTTNQTCEFWIPGTFTDITYIASSSNLTLPTSFTLSVRLWIASGTSWIAVGTQNATGDDYTMLIDNTFYLGWSQSYNVLTVAIYSSIYTLKVYDTLSNTTNQWLNIVVTYDSTSGTLELYRNGVFVAGAIEPQLIPVWNGHLPLQIGSNYEGLSFGGFMSDVILFNTVLSDPQINLLYHTKPIRQPNPPFVNTTTTTQPPTTVPPTTTSAPTSNVTSNVTTTQAPTTVVPTTTPPTTQPPTDLPVVVIPTESPITLPPPSNVNFTESVISNDTLSDNDTSVIVTISPPTVIMLIPLQESSTPFIQTPTGIVAITIGSLAGIGLMSAILYAVSKGMIVSGVATTASTVSSAKVAGSLIRKHGHAESVSASRSEKSPFLI